MKLSERIDEWLMIMDSRKGERYLERYNKKLQKLLKKGGCLFATTQIMMLREMLLTTHYSPNSIYIWIEEILEHRNRREFSKPQDPDGNV